jgi:hypothetical protein
MRRVGILLAVGALLLTMTAGMAVAGTGVGGVFNLGKTNAVNAISVLKGSAKGAMLRIVNSGPGAALQLVVKPGQAPMTVNSAGKVANLNSDQLDGLDQSAFLRSGAKAADAEKLDGKDSTDFYAAGGKVADSTHADNATKANSAAYAADAGTLDGKDSTEFLASNGKAADSDLLDGKDSAAFLASDGKAQDADKLDGRDSTSFLASKTYFLSKTFSVPMGSTTPTTGTAECDEGDVLLNGGYAGAEVTTFINGAAPSQTASGPQRTYSVSATNDGLVADEVAINITCADLSPDNPVR